MELDPRPYDTLERLYASDPRGSDVVDARLDALEKDPGQAVVRRRHLRPPGLWYIPFRLSAAEDWMILWEQVDDTVVVRHLGPDVLS